MTITSTETVGPLLGSQLEIVAEERIAGPADGIALCLSGGGYRAMLFHAGAIIRSKAMDDQVMNQENHYLSALGSAISIKISGDKLTIIYGDGQSQLNFVKQ